LQDYYYGEQEETIAKIGVSIEVEADGLDQIQSVIFPSDVAKLGGAENAEVEYESLNSVSNQNHQQSFLSLFPNRFASCIKRGKEGGWRETSQFHHLSDEEIIEAISGKSPFLRAVKHDKTTRFIAITLEKDSFYRTSEGLGKIRDCLRCLGVNQLKLYMFDENEQWQLFAYFKTPIESEKVSALLSAWLRRNGIVPGTAGVSLFPGTEPFCIPLQPGFAWINDNGHVIVQRNEVSPEAALALFVSDVERTETEGDELIERLEQILTKS